MEVNHFHNYGGPAQLMQACLSGGTLKAVFYHCRGPVKVVQAILGDKKNVEGIFTTVEVLLRLFMPVWVSRKIQRAVFTIGQVLQDLYNYFPKESCRKSTGPA